MVVGNRRVVDESDCGRLTSKQVERGDSLQHPVVTNKEERLMVEPVMVDGFCYTTLPYVDHSLKDQTQVERERGRHIMRGSERGYQLTSSA